MISNNLYLAENLRGQATNQPSTFSHAQRQICKLDPTSSLTLSLSLSSSLTHPNYKPLCTLSHSLSPLSVTHSLSLTYTQSLKASLTLLISFSISLSLPPSLFLSHPPIHPLTQCLSYSLFLSLYHSNSL